MKLGRVQQDSVNFNNNVFGNIFRKNRRVEARLKGVQRELNKRITSDLVTFEADLQKEYRGLLKQEELLWFQKARENHVRFGDRNTAYFHAHTVIRRKRNMIYKLKLRDGEWCSSQKDLANEALSYFQTLFAEVPQKNMTKMTHNIFPSLSEAATTFIGSPVEKEEVHKALMSMRSLSAPGPDGFQPFFFKKYWNKVGNDLWRLVSVAF